MFGKKWEPAVGKLLASRYVGKPVPYVYLMEVRPLSGGEAFRCECRQPWGMASFKGPPLNAEIKMECIPSKKKARFDRSEPAIDNSAAERAEHDSYQALLHGTPGAPAAPASDPAGQLFGQLTRLRDLLEAGEITEQQFADELTTINQQLSAMKARRSSAAESNES